METWPQRENFKTRMKAWQEATGSNQTQVAEALGLKLPSLRQLLYQPSRKPSQETARKAAELFQCSITEFMDDPGAVIAGQSTEGMSEKSRFLASLMFDKFKADDLTDEDREILYQDWLQNHDRLRALKARHEKKP